MRLVGEESRSTGYRNNKVKRDEIGTESAGKQEKWKKGNNGEGVINFAQSPPPAKLSFKI